MRIKIYDVDSGDLVRDMPVNDYSEYKYFIDHEWHWYVLNGCKVVIEGQIG